MSLWCDIPSSALTAGHGWRWDTEMDQPLGTYWLHLLAFEVTGGNGTAI